MNDNEEAVELLSISARELRSLKAMLSAEIADEVFGFVAQQAIETSLKAWLCALGVRYPFTHDLQELAALLGDNEVELDALPRFADLNPYAVEFRYSSRPRPALDRAEVVSRVEAVLAQARQRIVPESALEA